MFLTNEKIRENIEQAVKRVAEQGGAWRGIQANASARTADRYRAHAAAVGARVTVRPARYARGKYDIELA